MSDTDERTFVIAPMRFIATGTARTGRLLNGDGKPVKVIDIFDTHDHRSGVDALTLNSVMFVRGWQLDASLRCGYELAQAIKDGSIEIWDAVPDSEMNYAADAVMLGRSSLWRGHPPTKPQSL